MPSKIPVKVISHAKFYSASGTSTVCMDCRGKENEKQSSGKHLAKQSSGKGKEVDCMACGTRFYSASGTSTTCVDCREKGEHKKQAEKGERKKKDGRKSKTKRSSSKRSSDDSKRSSSSDVVCADCGTVFFSASGKSTQCIPCRSSRSFTKGVAKAAKGGREEKGGGEEKDGGKGTWTAEEWMDWERKLKAGVLPRQLDELPGVDVASR